MKITEMEDAINEAKAELARADLVALKMAELLAGRLRNVQGWNSRRVLVKLKRELRDFDATRMIWKEEK